jgi:hypothetical protein
VPVLKVGVLFIVHLEAECVLEIVAGFLVGESRHDHGALRDGGRLEVDGLQPGCGNRPDCATPPAAGPTRLVAERPTISTANSGAVGDSQLLGSLPPASLVEHLR